MSIIFQSSRKRTEVSLLVKSFTTGLQFVGLIEGEVLKRNVYHRIKIGSDIGQLLCFPQARWWHLQARLHSWPALRSSSAVLNLSNYNKDGSLEAPHFTWVLRGFKEKKAWLRQGWRSGRNWLGLSLRMFEWFFIFTHRHLSLSPPSPLRNWGFLGNSPAKKLSLLLNMLRNSIRNWGFT
jgi:hypothetical protein